MRSTGHTALDYVFFPTPLLPLPSWTQIFSWTPYSRIPSAYFAPLIIRNHVSRPYKTIDKIIVLFILIFIFLGLKLEGKRFCTDWWQAFPDFNLFEIYSWMKIYIYLFIYKQTSIRTIYCITYIFQIAHITLILDQAVSFQRNAFDKIAL